MRVAIAALSILVFPALGSAQSDTAASALPAILERARAADSGTDYAAALDGYREYGERCLAMTTAVLERCADAPAALSRAFELARALGDASAAERVASLFTEQLLYAEPRESIRIGYELARMPLEAERLDRAEDALERWDRLFRDSAPGQQILADALRARIALASGRDRRAAMYWRRADRAFDETREDITADGPIPIALVKEAVAEARLLRAEPLVERFLATRAPRVGRARNAEDLWRHVLSPRRVRTERRLLLARMELERVYELGSPRHSVIAAARIGEMYGHLADMHESMPLPDDEWIRMLAHHGQDHPGYDEALTHLETCVTWAHHHAVAPRWARRCEEALHTLDPQRYPVPEELSGHAEYLPISIAPPPAR